MSFFTGLSEDNKMRCVVISCGSVVAVAIVAALALCTIYAPAKTEPTIKVRVVPVEDRP